MYIYTCSPRSFFINYHIKRNRSHRLHKKTIQSNRRVEIGGLTVFSLPSFVVPHGLGTQKMPYFSHSVFGHTSRKIILAVNGCRSFNSYRAHTSRYRTEAKASNSTWPLINVFQFTSSNVKICFF